MYLNSFLSISVVAVVFVLQLWPLCSSIVAVVCVVAVVFMFQCCSCGLCIAKFSCGLCVAVL